MSGPYFFVGTKDFATGLLDVGSLGYAPKTGYTMDGGGLVLTVTDSMVMWNASSGVLPGTVGTKFLTLVGSNNSAAALAIFCFSGNPGVNYQYAGGTAAAPIQPNSGAVMGVTGWAGWEGSDYGANRARMRVLAVGTWSVTGPATKMIFSTSSGGAVVDRFTISELGDLIIGTNSFTMSRIDGTLQLRNSIVASLPYTINGVAAPAGALRFATDVTVTTPGQVAVGGGSGKKPVYFDSSSWFIM